MAILSKSTKPSPEDEVSAFRKKLDDLLDEAAENLKLQAPNVPLCRLRADLINRFFGCQCAAVLDLEQQK
jgi:hypothetical protein